MTLDIAAGEFFSLLGPSGCGKTTSLRMIGGFADPTDGSILLDGDDVTGLPPNERDVNTVFQSYAVFDHLNVADNVAFGLRRRKVRARPRSTSGSATCSTSCSSTGMADRRPRTLSGGQRQRVALARALVNRPAVLLLDEPLAALDLKLRRQMQVELKQIQREVGITFVFVTHDQDEALTMSDRVAVMNGGVGRAVRHARGRLRAARHPVRRVVHGHVQPDAGVYTRTAGSRSTAARPSRSGRATASPTAPR